jgi:hypothetical protein
MPGLSSGGGGQARRGGGWQLMGMVPAAAVLVLGLAAVTISLRQRNPRVPFIAVLGLIVLTAVATGAMLVAFNPEP